jgi:hypothetical protein
MSVIGSERVKSRHVTNVFTNVTFMSDATPFYLTQYYSRDQPNITTNAKKLYCFIYFNPGMFRPYISMVYGIKSHKCNRIISRHTHVWNGCTEIRTYAVTSL